MPVVTSYNFHLARGSTVLDGNSGENTEPSVGTLANGTWLAAYTTDGAVVRGRIMTANGASGTADTVLPVPGSTNHFDPLPAGGIQIDSEVTGLAGGRAVVAYASESRVYASIYNADGTHVTSFHVSGVPVELGAFSNPIPPGGLQFNVDVAALANGNFTAVWEDGDSALHFGTFTSDGAWASWGSVIDWTSGGGDDPTIAGLAGGGFAVAFSRETAGNTAIHYRVYTAGGVAVTPVLLGDDQGTINRKPVIAATPDGGFVVAYEDNGWNGNVEITLAKYTASGAFVNWVNVSNAAGTQYNPSITVLDNGFIAVGYSSGSNTQIRVLTDTLADTGILNGSTWTNNSEDLALSFLANGHWVAVENGMGSDGNVHYAIGSIRRTSIGDGAADTIIGDSLIETIDGGGSGDVLDGRGGRDIINGGAGDDYVYFDPEDDLANVLGGADFDTLIVKAGTNATGFDLTAHQFEQARVDFTDTGGQPWSTSSQYFLPGWVLNYQDTYYDNGTRQVQVLDTGAPDAWSSYTDYYTAAGLLEARQTVFDNGRRENQYFDLPPNDPWSSYIDYFNTGGQLEARRTFNDNGTYATTYFDLTGQSWSSYTDYNYGPANQLTARQTVFDNGFYDSTYLDPLDANAWSQYTDHFNASGTFLGRTGVWDDGTPF